MSLCIAAPCKHNNEPCIVLCCDTAGTRGDMKSEDVIKLRDVGETTVLLAGNMSHARELLAACTPALMKYPSRGNDIEITKLKIGLTEAVRQRKREMATGVLASQLGLSYDEVFNWSQSHPNAPIWADAWQIIRRMEFDAALIVATFTDDESAILAIDASGSVMWPDHYAAVGSGSHIASVILSQRPYWDSMSLSQCVYRVVEAKAAAEKNPHVGHFTLLEIVTPNSTYGTKIQNLHNFVQVARNRLEELPPFEFDLTRDTDERIRPIRE